jgi:hypothetical protein
MLETTASILEYTIFSAALHSSANSVTYDGWPTTTPAVSQKTMTSYMRRPYR